MVHTGAKINGPGDGTRPPRGPDHRRAPVAAQQLTLTTARTLHTRLERTAIPMRLVLRQSKEVWDRNPTRAAELEQIERAVFALERRLTNQLRISTNARAEG